METAQPDTSKSEVYHCTHVGSAEPDQHEGTNTHTHTLTHKLELLLKCTHHVHSRSVSNYSFKVIKYIYFKLMLES